MRLPVLQIVHRPGIIDLGWGHPDPALLPVEALRRASAAALELYGSDALQYGHSAGPGPLREWLITRIGASEGRAPEPDEIMITAGISHGLDQLLALCTRPGDIILAESPTYHLALRILRDHPLELLPIPADDCGLQVKALAETLASLKRAGRRARALYLVPTFNNPKGVSLSDERRRALVELAATEDLLIMEDDVYRELAYDGPAPPSLWSLARPGTVARLGTFSKTLAPGLRLGWLTASPAIVTRLAESGVPESGGGINHFTALVVAALCAAGDYEPNLERLCRTYRARRDALVAALRAHLPPGCVVHAPHGGFFVWVTLPAGCDSAACLPQAEAAGVAYAPGAAFHLQGDRCNGLRVAFCLYEPDVLAEAAERLGRGLRLAGV